MFSCQKYFSEKAVQNDKKEARNLKRTSFSASKDGAATVEASLILPLFLIVLLLLASAGEFLMIHGQIAHGLKEAACQAATAEYAADRAGKGGKILSGISAGAVFLSSVDRQFLDRSGLLGGSKKAAASIRLTKNAKEEYEAQLTYTIRKEYPFLPEITGVYTQKIRQKALTGYVPDGDERSEGMVYITPHESVYHTDLNCTHLALDISVDDEVEKYLEGKTAYKECEKCTKYHDGEIVCLYVAKEGEAYHTDLSCSGLKRTVQQVDKSTLKGVKPCQRCKKQEDT